MKEYAEYKNTQSEWYGKIPTDWKIGKVRQLFKLRKEKNYKPLEDVNLLSLYTEFGVIQNGEVEYNSGNKAVSADGYKVVHKNDIVVNIILSWMGAIGLSNFDGVTSPAYDVYEPINLNEINPVYFHHLFRTKAFSGECFKKGRGIMLMRWRTYSPEFKSISIPIPPITEQNAIVEYLDKKTKQIDEFVNAKEKEIAALKELKKTLVADAVTKGISNEELVDTGIEWLPKIPKGWSILKLKYACKQRTDKYSSNDGNLEYFGLENIVKESGIFIKTESEYELENSTICQKGDVVFGKLRPYLAKSWIVDKKRCCSSEFAVFYGFNGIPEFYKYLFISVPFSQYIDSSTKGTKMPRANIDFIKGALIAIPPISEQKSIAEYLDKKTTDIDTMISSIKKQIDLVKELRTKIIADAVTGKVDVRK